MMNYLLTKDTRNSHHFLLLLVSLVMASFSVTSLFSCTEKEDEEPYVKSVDDGKTITATGNDWTGWSTTLQSNISVSELQTICSASWCSARLSESSNGNYMLTVNAEDNLLLEDRQATITVKGANASASVSFILIQQAGRPYIKFGDSETDMIVNNDARLLERAMETNMDFSKLKVSSSEKWCTPTLENTGSGLTLKLNVTENTTIYSRTSSITVKSSNTTINASFNVKQTGKPGVVIASMSGTQKDIDATAQELNWAAESSIAFDDLVFSSNEEWCQIKAEPTSNDVEDISSFIIAVTVNENMSDKQREAVITVSSPSRHFSTSYLIVQSAATFTMSNSQLGFDRDGGKRTVTISSNVSWKAECDADWVTLEQNDGYLTIRITKTNTDRTVRITFKEKENSAITINQTKYKVGDEYSEGGVTGTVGYIGDDKRFIFKFVGEKLRWIRSGTASGIAAKDKDDGEANMEVIRNLIATRSMSFPAFEAADALNTGGVSGWYLPAINELAAMKSFITGNAWSSTANMVATAYYHDGKSIGSKDNTQQCMVYAIHKY